MVEGPHWEQMNWIIRPRFSDCHWEDRAGATPGTKRWGVLLNICRDLPLNIHAECISMMCQLFCEKTKINIRNSILISLLGPSNQLPSPQSKELVALSLSFSFFFLSLSPTYGYLVLLLTLIRTPPPPFLLCLSFVKSLFLHHKFFHVYMFSFWWSMSAPRPVLLFLSLIVSHVSQRRSLCPPPLLHFSVPSAWCDH